MPRPRKPLAPAEKSDLVDVVANPPWDRAVSADPPGSRTVGGAPPNQGPTRRLAPPRHPGWPLEASRNDFGVSLPCGTAAPGCPPSRQPGAAVPHEVVLGWPLLTHLPGRGRADDRLDREDSGPLERRSGEPGSAVRRPLRPRLVPPQDCPRPRTNICAIIIAGSLAIRLTSGTPKTVLPLRRCPPPQAPNELQNRQDFFLTSCSFWNSIRDLEGMACVPWASASCPDTVPVASSARRSRFPGPPEALNSVKKSGSFRRVEATSVIRNRGDQGPCASQAGFPSGEKRDFGKTFPARWKSDLPRPEMAIDPDDSV